ncbi:hypothetical protein EV1_040710 [Malus domestica]
MVQHTHRTITMHVTTRPWPGVNFDGLEALSPTTPWSAAINPQLASLVCWASDPRAPKPEVYSLRCQPTRLGLVPAAHASKLSCLLGFVSAPAHITSR